MSGVQWRFLFKGESDNVFGGYVMESDGGLACVPGENITNSMANDQVVVVEEEYEMSYYSSITQAMFPSCAPYRNITCAGLSLDDYLAGLGFSKDLPLEKYRSSVDDDRLEQDVEQFPNGVEDNRGMRFLFYLREFEDDALNIVFAGNYHIPYLYNSVVSFGFKPYVISTYQYVKPDADISLEMLRVLRRYPIVPPKKGKPVIFIDDSHIHEFEMPLPNPEDLKKLSIQRVLIQTEGADSDDSSEEVEKTLRFSMSSGHRILYRYVQLLKASGIEVVLHGLEKNFHTMPW